MADKAPKTNTGKQASKKIVPSAGEPFAHTHTISTDGIVHSHSSYQWAPSAHGNQWSYNTINTNPNQYPNQYPQPGVYPGVTTNPPPMTHTVFEPKNGQVGMIAGVVHRFDGGKWIPVHATDETVEAPEVRIVLDASAMLNALRSYVSFLDDLDGLDQDTHNIVDDTLFGLREAVEALEKIGLK